MPTFRRNMLSPSSGLKWQTVEVERCCRVWGRKAEGKGPIREKGYGGKDQDQGAGQHQHCTNRRQNLRSHLFHLVSMDLIPLEQKSASWVSNYEHWEISFLSVVSSEVWKENNHLGSGSDCQVGCTKTKFRRVEASVVVARNAVFLCRDGSLRSGRTPSISTRVVVP
jgi:hypothetical protein